MKQTPAQVFSRNGDWTERLFFPMLTLFLVIQSKVEPNMENQTEENNLESQAFQKYFTLEEAAQMLPAVKEALAMAQRQMNELRDEVILSKRLLLAKRSSGRRNTEPDVTVLHQKFERFEEALQRWVDYFAQQGIILRDLDTGLIDFPYRAQSNEQDYLLCWRLPEDGIFYFHGLNEGFAGRHPITFLPD